VNEWGEGGVNEWSGAEVTERATEASEYTYRECVFEVESDSVCVCVCMCVCLSKRETIRGWG